MSMVAKLFEFILKMYFQTFDSFKENEFNNKTFIYKCAYFSSE